MITFAYGRNTMARQKLLWDEIRSLVVHIKEESWILLRDFNEVLHVDERSGPRDRSNAGLANFRNLDKQVGLTEMYTRGGAYTWSNGAIGVRRSESKID